MKLNAFLKKLNDQPESVTFDDTMAAIAEHYDFTPAAFTNGALRNEAGQNSGSCKLLAFAQLNGLSKDQTLACFGAYYREDVLKNPEGSDHQNIRNFMRHGWDGVRFDSMPLQAKQG
ncbi:MAG TPA: HopJ type III effector protein [Noviherbaspirillum sp.]|uniref:HopJ type III effector protein n=1 Tax=Noviherbaspirillum sp. TaxID=1926288 RepID=UPI002D2908AD|nr:HopJ type III effector protein [Noviherbaspirillum sp.]HYD94980.1 HopJ type III effector protein [Noviherbaspirillum sp.]